MTGDSRRGNIGASIRDRLLNKARADKLDFNLLLTRYALERLLFRMSISEQRDQFLLKGALLFDLWFDIPHRPSRDADFLGLGAAEIPRLEEVFRAISRIKVEDGIVYQPETVKAVEIRQEANYAGIRVTLTGLLDSARCPVQIDIGFGDLVTPAPEEAKYPVILPGMPAPRIRVYPRYTVVAEKLEAIVSLGMLNSRMKDFFDLWVLAERSEFSGQVLSRAIAGTFDRRRTSIPDGVPLGMSDEFVDEAQKQKQWQAFIQKNALEPVALSAVVADLRQFLLPVLESISAGREFEATWRTGERWC